MGHAFLNRVISQKVFNFLASRVDRRQDGRSRPEARAAQRGVHAAHSHVKRRPGSCCGQASA